MVVNSRGIACCHKIDHTLYSEIFKFSNCKVTPKNMTIINYLFIFIHIQFSIFFSEFMKQKWTTAARGDQGCCFGRSKYNSQYSKQVLR